jgi:glycosyltransferase involved in cell wall biosynthesis
MSGTESAVSGALRAGKQIWRSLAPLGLRRLAQPLVLALAERRVMAQLRRPEPQQQPGPLIVSGLISETKGVSEAARLTIAGLKAAGYPVVAHDLRQTLDQGPGGNGRLPSEKAGGVWIAHVNPPEALHAMAYLDPESWRGRYRIGYWAYELPRVPELWVKASAAFHEIWAPSAFVAQALEDSGVDRLMRVMPHPAWLGTIGQKEARTGHFRVLAMGDIASSPTRKNLVGAVEIYAAAFKGPGEAELTLKLQGAADDPAVKQLRALTGGRPDIKVIAERLSADDMAKLIASSDVLLSPHRAEGFGLPLAEALLAGVPALGTAWSGNMDFMSDYRELQIASKLVPVNDRHGVYAMRGVQWAEPDVTDAVAKLRALFDNPERRPKLAERGRNAVLALKGAWTREALDETVLGELVEV